MKQRAYIADMRGRLGLEPDDASRDSEIEAMSATQRLAMIAGWNLGYSGWEHTILKWVRDAGFKISEPEKSK